MTSRRRRLAAVGVPALAAGLLGLAGCGTAAAPEPAESLTVYAAASLVGPVSDLLAEYATDHSEVSVEPAVFDGSSTLVTQITESAAPDVIVTANETTMADLTAAGLVDQPHVVATNTLVIAVPEGNPAGIASLTDLADVDTVLCAPQVPCGDAGATLLQLNQVELDPLSLEQNVTAAAERVTSGAAEAALVYATDVAAREDQLDAIVPARAEEVVNRYPAATLTTASPAGAEFVELLGSARGTAVLADYGFGPP
ncbi:molybdate ABC transporter substrate-binding protein [Ruania alkalisoli]|uniref:Molybdate ABC transporter substrate-binding protein n=1 Tax=Ruania alkalisoli TaxID=2779775 RepID=A0A7M1SXM4_9MICO|nr:molybdate ABC transporter substrate-binding protein [Ruania alkalisoli]QOR71482.1 molybdate ABC transporter substrate-binding protein [Ruania alkalisoli]